MSPKKLVIAIDGPAASGKSTTGKLVADRLGYLHVDTGAMYRAVTLKVLRAGIPVTDVEHIAELLRTTRVELLTSPAGVRVVLDGEDVTVPVRGVDVTRAVSAVSSLHEVRAAMVREQRRMGAGGGIVLEGRDIGTVVFPNADLKFFVIAGIEERARRRKRDLLAAGTEADVDTLVKEIEERDLRDSTRTESPLKRAPDAIVLDTSDLTIEEQVEFVVRRVTQLLEQES